MQPTPQLELDKQTQQALQDLCDVALRAAGMNAFAAVVHLQTRMREAADKASPPAEQ